MNAFLKVRKTTISKLAPQCGQRVLYCRVGCMMRIFLQCVFNRGKGNAADRNLDKKAFADTGITVRKTATVIIEKKVFMRFAMVTVCGAVAGAGVVTDEKLFGHRGAHCFFSLG